MSLETERAENQGAIRGSVFERHAVAMASYAGIIISEKQIDDYVQLRAVHLDGREQLSDQRLLYLLLDSSQQTVFKEKYQHINFDYANSEEYLEEQL